jgi:hypothetical protein
MIKKEKREKVLINKRFNYIWPTILKNNLSIYLKKIEIHLHGFYNKFVKFQKILAYI